MTIFEWRKGYFTCILSKNLTILPGDKKLNLHYDKCRYAKSTRRPER